MADHSSMKAGSGGFMEDLKAGMCELFVIFQRFLGTVFFQTRWVCTFSM